MPFRWKKKLKYEEKTFKKYHFLSWHLFSVEEFEKNLRTTLKAAKVFSWNSGVIIFSRFWNFLPQRIDRTDIYYVSSYVTPFFILLKKSKILNRVTNLQPYVKNWRVFQTKKKSVKGSMKPTFEKKNLVCVQLIWLECMNDFLDQTLFTSQLFSYNFKKNSPQWFTNIFLNKF